LKDSNEPLIGRSDGPITLKIVRRFFQVLKKEGHQFLIFKEGFIELVLKNQPNLSKEIPL